MASQRSRSLLVRGLQRWLRASGGGAPARRCPVRPGVEVLERRETPSGAPFLVKDIETADLGSYPTLTTNASGTLFFDIDNGSHGNELWKSNGNSGGTQLVKDIDSGPGNSSPSELTNVNGTLFFGAHDGSHGYELWKSDGSSSRHPSCQGRRRHRSGLVRPPLPGERGGDAVLRSQRRRPRPGTAEERRHL